MTARCKKCNAHRDFRNKRGAKLSDMVCSCGGSFELMSCGYSVHERIYINRSGVKFTTELFDETKIRFVQL